MSSSRGQVRADGKYARQIAFEDVYMNGGFASLPGYGDLHYRAQVNTLEYCDDEFADRESVDDGPLRLRGGGLRGGGRGSRRRGCTSAQMDELVAQVKIAVLSARRVVGKSLREVDDALGAVTKSISGIHDEDTRGRVCGEVIGLPKDMTARCVDVLCMIEYEEAIKLGVERQMKKADFYRDLLHRLVMRAWNSVCSVEMEDGEVDAELKVSAGSALVGVGRRSQGKLTHRDNLACPTFAQLYVRIRGLYAFVQEHAKPVKKKSARGKEGQVYEYSRGTTLNPTLSLVKEFLETTHTDVEEHKSTGTDEPTEDETQEDTSSSADGTLDKELGDDDDGVEDEDEDDYKEEDEEGVDDVDKDDEDEDEQDEEVDEDEEEDYEEEESSDEETEGEAREQGHKSQKAYRRAGRRTARKLPQDKPQGDEPELPQDQNEQQNEDEALEEAKQQDERQQEEGHDEDGDEEGDVQVALGNSASASQSEAPVGGSDVDVGTSENEISASDGSGDLPDRQGADEEAHAQGNDVEETLATLLPTSDDAQSVGPRTFCALLEDLPHAFVDEEGEVQMDDEEWCIFYNSLLVCAILYEKLLR